jgi:hypothetical protein
MAEMDYRAIEQELRSKMPAPFHPAQNPLGPTVEVAEAEGEPRVLIQLPKPVTIAEYDQHRAARGPAHDPRAGRPLRRPAPPVDGPRGAPGPHVGWSQRV